MIRSGTILGISSIKRNTKARKTKVRNRSRFFANFRFSCFRVPLLASMVSTLFPVFLFSAFLGCAHPQQTRMQKPDENEKDKAADVKTIRDVASFANTDPIQVSGVGIVVGLDGTGGDPPPGGYRDMLLNDLRKRGVENPKEVLASPNNVMVLVTARIPAGARKGDPLDLDVIIPPGSKATSLRGGYLRDCPLYNYETTKNLNPNS